MNTTKSTQEIWDTYLETFDHGKTGSKTFRLDLIDKAPLINYDQLLIVGTKYTSKQNDGFPDGKDFDLLYRIGDELMELLEDNTAFYMVGSFLYNSERLEYFYIQDAEGLIEKIETYFQLQYPKRQFFITIKEDKQWKYYKEFLFPKYELEVQLQTS